MAQHHDPLNADTAAPGVHVRLRELLRLRAAARDLRVAGRRHVATDMAGAYASAFRGRGIDFDEVRPYQPGDDIRNMDWRVTARTGRPHTKLFHEERERPVLVAVDQGPTMAFGSRRAFKRVAAAEAAALIGWSALANGDRVGGLCFSGEAHREFRPLRGERGVIRLLKGLVHGASAAADHPSALGPVLRRLRHVARPGTALFIISDFRAWDETAASLLSQLAKHNPVILIFVFDPLERQLPPPGRYPVTDGDRQFILDNGPARLQRDFQRQFAEHQAAVENFSRSRGIQFLTLATDDDVARVLGKGLRPRP